MPDYEKLLKANLPEALESAIEALDGNYQIPKQLLQVDVSAFEQLPCVVFAYFDRNDIFYLNRAGRELLNMKLPTFDRSSSLSTPIFWLEDDAHLLSTDEYVAGRQLPLLKTRELITLSWGKTWLEGAKFPIRSQQGQTLAILFAGQELVPSRQISQVAEHYSTTLHGFGDN